MQIRSAARLGAVAAGVLVPVLAGAGPALAAMPDDGDEPGKPLSTGLLILFYIVIPLGAFLVISALALLPSAMRRPRYRPGRPWNHDPLWFLGPDDPDNAVASARPGATSRGGASAEW